MRMGMCRSDSRGLDRLVTAVGALLLLGGVGVGFLGPLEMHCFYLLSEGGRHHYPGFGFGSFMFGNIAAQIVGYYLISAALVVLGDGHLKHRSWARKITLTLLWTWLVVGAPVVAAALFVLAGTKDLSHLAFMSVAVFLGLSYLVFPWLLIRLYRSQRVVSLFEGRDPKHCWVESLPIEVLVLSTLYFLTEAFLQQGYLVAGFDLFDDNLSRLQRSFADRLLVCRTDVTKDSEVSESVEAVIKRWGRIDILVNNACLAIFESFEQKDIEDTKREFDVNYFGYVRMIRAVLPHMKARKILVTKPTITPNLQTGLYLLLSRLFPRAVGRFMGKMAEKGRGASRESAG